MANPSKPVLNAMARAALKAMGFTDAQIRAGVRAGRAPKPMPQANTSRPPAPAPKPVSRRSRVNGRVVAGTDTRPSVGQTQPPRQGPRTANVPQQARPLSAQKPSGPASLMSPEAKAQATRWLASKSPEAAAGRALLQAQGLRLANAAGAAGTALAIVDQAGKVFNPDNNLLTALNDLRLSATNGGRVVPGHSRFQAPQSGPVGPQQTPEMVANYRQERDARHAKLRADLDAQPPLRGNQPGIARIADVAPVSSADTTPRAAQPANLPAAQPVAPASETYRDGGKGLYQGTQAYRDAIGGSGNPLLNRLRRDMGLDPATGNRASAPTRAQDRIPHNPGNTISEPLQDPRRALLNSHNPGATVSESISDPRRALLNSHNPGLTVSEPIAQQVVEKVAESLFEQMQRRRGRLRGAGHSDLNDLA